MLGGYPHRLDEAQRPELLKMVEADTKAKLEKAGIPFSRSRFADDIGMAGDPRLIVMVPMDEANSSMEFTTEVKLLQNVRLSRDPSIETAAVTWSRQGSVGGPGPGLRGPRIRDQIGGEIDQFIRDYLSVNPGQSASSNQPRVSNARKR